MENAQAHFLFIFTAHTHYAAKKQVRMKVLKEIIWKINLVGKRGLPKEVRETDVWWGTELAGEESELAKLGNCI